MECWLRSAIRKDICRKHCSLTARCKIMAWVIDFSLCSLNSRVLTGSESFFIGISKNFAVLIVSRVFRNKYLDASVSAREKSEMLNLLCVILVDTVKAFPLINLDKFSSCRYISHSKMKTFLRVSFFLFACSCLWSTLIQIVFWSCWLSQLSIIWPNDLLDCI